MPAVSIRQEEVGNKILVSLPSEEFAQIAPLLEAVGLEVGDRLYDVEEVIRHVHFIDGGLLSLLSTLEDGTSIEVGALGREGLGGLSVLLGFILVSFLLVLASWLRGTVYHPASVAPALRLRGS